MSEQNKTAEEKKRADLDRQLERIIDRPWRDHPNWIEKRYGLPSDAQ